jgi:hypothetical protein
MRVSQKILLAGLFVALVGFGLSSWLVGSHVAAEPRGPSSAGLTSAPSGGSAAAAREWPDNLPSLPDPNSAGSARRVFIDRGFLDAAVFALPATFTPPVVDEASIAERARAIAERGERALAEFEVRMKRLRLDSPPTRAQAMHAMGAWRSFALVLMYEGKLLEAKPWFERALEMSQRPDIPAREHAELRALLGLCALRRGELENCVACLGPSSCIFPIDETAYHTVQAGSREAVTHFTAYLEEFPGDLRVRWLLNLAHMTLGEYPDKVPAKYRVPLDRFRSRVDIGRFSNVALAAGLTVRGTKQAGGAIFDDFNNDGLPDVFSTSDDPGDGASLFINRGDGTFEDRSAKAGLLSQVYALNVARADFDNDGNLDVVLLRGGWEKMARLSLLRNKGDGIFEDVTVASGLDVPIATESAAWADYDNDGLVDLFVCGEYLAPADNTTAAGAVFDDRNRCRLYHNLGGGKFVDVAAKADVINEHCSKGAVWGDYDNDGRPDLFVSNMFGPVPARLYHNEGDGTFRDVASEAGIDGAPKGFATLFWDYDNDGWLDIFLCEFKSSLADSVASYMGLPTDPDLHPRLYHNLRNGKFRDVSTEVGLGRPMATMSVNCGDLDNDGWLDLHMGTGWMSYSGLMPNLTFKNMGGKRFEDVTESSGTGHLQKGHGVSFADYDADGDLDLFAVMAGGMPGDKGFNVLFQNPGHGRHWLKVKLVGTKTNRAALGARLRAEVKGPDGQTRSIHRMIGTNGSFGGNSLTESLGLLDATQVEELTVTWPTSQTTQTFRSIAADQTIEITEGRDAFKALPRPTAKPRRQ